MQPPLTCSLDPSKLEYKLDKGKRKVMSRSRHTEPQVIAALKQVQVARTFDDVARKQWSIIYGGGWDLTYGRPLAQI